jgi:hypothetical protein
MSAAGRIARLVTNDGAWDVPFEIAIACSSSVFVGLIRERAGRGEFPLGPARVSAHGRQLVAVVSYLQGDVFLPLDVQLQALSAPEPGA